jgi:hypothetical protein
MGSSLGVAQSSVPVIRADLVFPVIVEIFGGTFQQPHEALLYENGPREHLNVVLVQSAHGISLQVSDEFEQ